MAVRRKTTTRTRRPRRRKSGGHPFLVAFFFLFLIFASAYVTDRMTNRPTAEVAQNVTTIHHIFNDKEMQGLVPKEDTGTPESVKEKIKAAIDKVVTVKVNGEDKKLSSKKQDRTETKVASKSAETAESVETSAPKAPAETQKEEPKESSFSISSVISKVTGKPAPAPEEKQEIVAPSVSTKETLTENKSTVTINKPAPEEEKSTVMKATLSKPSPVKSVPKTTVKSSSNEGKSTVTVNKPKPKTVPAAAPKVNQPAKVSGRLAIVIDDAGRDLDSQHVYENMGIPLTLAVMPNQVHTREAASSWAAHGLPVIIHQPMESVSGVGMEPKVILTSMSTTEMRAMLKSSFSQIPEAIGMNNHQGSKATIDRPTMDVVMNELHHRNMFFFDSRTNSTTVADAAAAAYGVRYARNDLFVDNEADVTYISNMIREGANRAEKYGTYVIIGHCRPKTAEAFRQMVPKLKAEGIQFVYLSSLTK